MQPCFKGVPSTTICKPITDAAGRLAGLVDNDGQKVMTSYMPVNGQCDESMRMQGVAIDNSGRVKNSPSGNPSQQGKGKGKGKGGGA